MSTKPRSFDTSLYYHVFNRGVDKRNTFESQRDYQRFLETIDYYRHDQELGYAKFLRLSLEDRAKYRLAHPKGVQTLRVRVFSYCLMPNHFHLLLKPLRKNGISIYLSDICNSYTRYFNLKNDRSGNLFQGTFKAKVISSEESLLQASRYIHLNPLFSLQTNPNGFLVNPDDYPYSSYYEWLHPENSNIVDQDEVDSWLKLWGGRKDYFKTMEERINYQLAKTPPDWFLDD